VPYSWHIKVGTYTGYTRELVVELLKNTKDYIRNVIFYYSCKLSEISQKYHKREFRYRYEVYMKINFIFKYKINTSILLHT